MTRKEWIHEHHPEDVSLKYEGGVFSCPYKNYELRKIDAGSESTACPYGLIDKCEKICRECWDKEIIRNGSDSMPIEPIKENEEIERLRKERDQLKIQLAHMSDLYITLASCIPDIIKNKETNKNENR